MADRLRVAPLGVVLLAVSLCACTTTTSPPPTTSSVQSSVTTTTGDPTGTTAPTTTTTTGSTSTTAGDDQLAIEAVQRYYAAFNEALVTLKTAEMRKLFEPGCLVCEQDVAEIDKMARNGERVTGGATTWSNFTVTLRAAKHLSLRADGWSDRFIIKDATGKVTTDQEAGRGSKNFTVFRRGDTWILQGIS